MGTWPVVHCLCRHFLFEDDLKAWKQHGVGSREVGRRIRSFSGPSHRHRAHGWLSDKPQIIFSDHKQSCLSWAPISSQSSLPIDSRQRSSAGPLASVTTSITRSGRFAMSGWSTSRTISAQQLLWRTRQRSSLMICSPLPKPSIPCSVSGSSQTTASPGHYRSRG